MYLFTCITWLVVHLHSLVVYLHSLAVYMHSLIVYLHSLNIAHLRSLVIYLHSLVVEPCHIAEVVRHMGQAAAAVAGMRVAARRTVQEVGVGTQRPEKMKLKAN